MDGDKITHTLSLYGRRLSAELTRFWQWWLGQLLELLPASLRRRLFRPGQLLCVYPGDDHYRLVQQPGGEEQPLTDIAPAALQQLQRKASQIRLCLPAGDLLLTRLMLPAATAANLDNVLRFEMDRHTPFSADQVYFGFAAGPREKNSPHIQVSLLLAPRAGVDAHLAELTSLGVTPTQLCDADHDDAPVIALPVPAGATARASRLKNLNGALVLVMLFLLIAVPLYHRQNRIDALTAELDVPRQRAEQAAALKRQLTALRDSQAFLGQKQASRTSTLPLLDELTRTLPDHTWLTRLELEQGSVQIRGESASASELIGLLEASPLFSDVRFSSPITNNPATSKDRFMITARLNEGGAP